MVTTLLYQLSNKYNHHTIGIPVLDIQELNITIDYDKKTYRLTFA